MSLVRDIKIDIYLIISAKKEKYQKISKKLNKKY